MNSDDYIIRGKYMVMLYHRTYRAQHQHTDSNILEQFNLWFYIDIFPAIGVERFKQIESRDFKISDFSNARYRMIGKRFDKIKREMLDKSTYIEKYLDKIKTEK